MRFIGAASEQRLCYECLDDFCGRDYVAGERSEGGNGRQIGDCPRFSERTPSIKSTCRRPKIKRASPGCSSRSFSRPLKRPYRAPVCSIRSPNLGGTARDRGLSFSLCDLPRARIRARRRHTACGVESTMWDLVEHQIENARLLGTIDKGRPGRLRCGARYRRRTTRSFNRFAGYAPTLWSDAKSP